MNETKEEAIRIDNESRENYKKEQEYKQYLALQQKFDNSSKVEYGYIASPFEK